MELVGLLSIRVVQHRIIRFPLEPIVLPDECRFNSLFDFFRYIAHKLRPVNYIEALLISGWVQLNLAEEIHISIERISQLVDFDDV